MKILTDILNLNILELNSLLISLESFFNINEEKQENNKNEIKETDEEIIKNYEIILKSFPSDKKISVLKTIKSLFNKGLKETKEILDTLPQNIFKTTNEKEMEEYKKKIEDAGGVVEIKTK